VAATHSVAGAEDGADGRGDVVTTADVASRSGEAGRKLRRLVVEAASGVKSSAAFGRP
jgi:hypothetical protein